MKSNKTEQVMVTGDVLPNGAGGFTVRPRRPQAEIGARDAAKLLGVHRSTLNLMVNYPLAKKFLRWRWNSDRKGKRLFDAASVIAYRDALQDPEVQGDAK